MPEKDAILNSLERYGRISDSFIYLFFFLFPPPHFVKVTHEKVKALMELAHLQQEYELLQEYGVFYKLHILLFMCLTCSLCHDCYNLIDASC